MKYFILFVVSFVLLSCTGNKLRHLQNTNKHKQLGDGYTVYQNEIYYKRSKANYSSEWYIPEKTEMHSESFTNLDNRYATDKISIFYRGETIPNVDFSSFSIIQLESEFPFYEKYILNPKFTYKLNQNIEKDIVTVSPSLMDLTIRNEITHMEYYAKDKNKVYYGKDVIFNADPNTFTILSILFSKDKSNVYFKGESISKSDSRSFDIICGFLAKDDNFIYYGDHIISKDPDSCEILNFNYVKNYKFVWFIRNLIFPRIELLQYGSSAKDFEIIDNRYAKDANNVFFHGLKIENANVEHFQVLGQNWSKDDKNIFKVNRLCSEADYETFEVTDEYVKDKNRFYDKKYKP